MRRHESELRRDLRSMRRTDQRYSDRRITPDEVCSETSALSTAHHASSDRRVDAGSAKRGRGGVLMVLVAETCRRTRGLHHVLVNRRANLCLVHHFLLRHQELLLPQPSAERVSAICVSRWIRALKSLRTCVIHPLTRMVLTSPQRQQLIPRQPEMPDS